VGFGLDDYGPRLSKLFMLGTYGLSLAGRPLIDLPDLYGQNSEQLRTLIGESFPYQFMSDELRALDVLHDRTFLEYRDALISRLMPIFGNPLLRRAFGPQKPPLDLARILRRRECVFLNLAGLEHRDAVLVGTAYVSLLFHQALQRQPDVEPYATVVIDEAFDFLTSDLARAFDRLRKRNIQLVIATQRLGQLQ
jgi:DNA helicase HerA-like ATPase